MKSIWVNPERCVACKTCEIVCALDRSSLSKKFPDVLYEDIPPVSRVKVEPVDFDKGFPIQCRHCEDAPCLDACPAGALHRDSEDFVLVHDHRCIGCWMCIMVCPFGAPKPFRHSRKMIKCDCCKEMDAPYCVESCPTQALMLVDSEEIARGDRKPSRMGHWIRLGFSSDSGLSKP